MSIEGIDRHSIADAVSTHDPGNERLRPSAMCKLAFILNTVLCT